MPMGTGSRLDAIFGVSYFVEPPRDMVELEAIELVLQLSDLMIIRSHLGVVAA